MLPKVLMAPRVLMLPVLLKPVFDIGRHSFPAGLQQGPVVAFGKLFVISNGWRVFIFSEVGVVQCCRNNIVLASGNE